MEVAYAEVNIETVFQPIMFSGKCHAFSASGLYCKVPARPVVGDFIEIMAREEPYYQDQNADEEAGREVLVGRKLILRVAAVALVAHTIQSRESRPLQISDRIVSYRVHANLAIAPTCVDIDLAREGFLRLNRWFFDDMEHSKVEPGKIDPEWLMRNGLWRPLLDLWFETDISTQSLTEEGLKEYTEARRLWREHTDGASLHYPWRL